MLQLFHLFLILIKLKLKVEQYTPQVSNKLLSLTQTLQIILLKIKVVIFMGFSVTSIYT